jgi:hypothetical protein
LFKPGVSEKLNLALEITDLQNQIWLDPRLYFLLIYSGLMNYAPALSTDLASISPMPADFLYNEISADDNTFEQKLQQQLRAAKQKLQAPDTPHLLKVVAYLRICCSAMRTHWLVQEGIYPGNLYLDLMDFLGSYDSEWWKQCRITNSQGLTSINPYIWQLLQPLEEFVWTISDDT